MAAGVEFRYFGPGASAGTGTTAETGWKFNREDSQSGTTPIPIPTTTGTNYSWLKNFGFYVTSTGGTISNYTIKAAGAQTTGIYLYFKAAAAYAQATSGNMPAAGGSNGAVPATYTLMTTSAQQWDATGASAGTTGQKGQFIEMVLGVGYDYVLGGNSALALQAMTAAYDEA